MQARLDPSVITALVVGGVVLLMLLRIGRMTRKRRIRIERLWIGPAIFIAVAGYMIAQFPPTFSVLSYASLSAAVVLGAVLGWFRGLTTRISVEVETHELMAQVSPWGLTILLVLILARMGVRRVLTGHVPANVLIDGFIVFYVSMIVVRRLEMFLRCKRLLAEARAARDRGDPVPEVMIEERG